MNQLIEKIMYQADEVNIPEDDQFCDTDFLADIDPRRVNLFAQMIIQECIAACSRVEEDDELSDYAGGFRDGALLCAEEIKEHFGVNQ